MATVIGKTSQRIDDLLADLLTQVYISNGRLYSQTRNGTITDLGPIDEGGSSGSATQEFTFATAALTWTCVHNLGHEHVDVAAYDSSGVLIPVVDVHFVDENTTQFTWYYPMSGTALIQR